MVLKSDKPIAQIARDLGVTRTTLYSWVNKNKTANTEENGTTNEQLFRELEKLERELAEVKDKRRKIKKEWDIDLILYFSRFYFHKNPNESA